MSPQFHVSFDKGFYSTTQEKLVSKWQEKTYFTTETVRSNKRKRTSEAAEQNVRPGDRHSEGASEGAQSQTQPSLERATEPTLSDIGVQPGSSADPNVVGTLPSGTPHQTW